VEERINNQNYTSREKYQNTPQYNLAILLVINYILVYSVQKSIVDPEILLMLNFIGFMQDGTGTLF
jgi:hypothetical protein